MGPAGGWASWQGPAQWAGRCRQRRRHVLFEGLLSPTPRPCPPACRSCTRISAVSGCPPRSTSTCTVPPTAWRDGHTRGTGHRLRTCRAWEAAGTTTQCTQCTQCTLLQHSIAYQMLPHATPAPAPLTAVVQQRLRAQKLGHDFAAQPHLQGRGAAKQTSKAVGRGARPPVHVLTPPAPRHGAAPPARLRSHGFCISCLQVEVSALTSTSPGSSCPSAGPPGTNDSTTSMPVLPGSCLNRPAGQGRKA